MNPNQPEPTFDESVKQVMLALPAPIREYLGQKRYSPIVDELTNKYSLHVDQAGVLERGIILLLMGIDDPNEFVTVLQRDGEISKETALEIIGDLNQEIFTPLQQAMRTEENKKPAGTTTHPPLQVPTMSTPMPKILNRLAPAPENLPGAMVAKTQSSTGSSSSPVKSLASEPKTAGIPLLEDHEEPHIEFKKISPVPAGIRPAPTRLQAPLPPAPAKYTVDPYRETPEEHEK